MAGGGGSDDGDPQNAPTAVLSISPTGTGMAGATRYRFDAGGSTDPDRDTLTFTWDFGDGSQGTGVTTTHAYAAAGAYTVTLTVSDGRTQTTATGSVTVGRNLDGARFVGSGEVAALGPVLELMQTGSGLSGRFSRETSPTDSARRSWTVSGQLTSPDDFVCPCGLRMKFQGATAGNRRPRVPRHGRRGRRRHRARRGRGRRHVGVHPAMRRRRRFTRRWVFTRG